MSTKKDLTKKKKNEVIHEAKIEKVGVMKNPKVGVGIVVGLLLLLTISGVIWIVKDHEPATKTDAERFKEDYESYNNKKEEDSAKVYPKTEIDEENPIVYSSYKEVLELLEEKNNKNAVIYFGFPTCPWCRTLIPELLKAADETGLEKIYYLNNVDSRDKKVLEDGKIKTEKEGSNDYKKLLEKLDSHLGEYEGLNDSSIKRLYFPTVLFVRDGKIIDIQISTLDSQEDGYKELTKEQKEELKKILVEKINKTITCDSAC